jgi:hypothetical protein
MTEETSPPASSTAELIGYGRIRWDELTRLLGNATTAWADYDGFHIGPAPSEPPPYSHLWAWTDHWLIRARIEDDTAIAGALILSPTSADAPPADSPSAGLSPAAAPPVQSNEQVIYQRAVAQTWSITEKRVGRLTPEVADHRADIFLIAGERPVTFVAAVRPA